MQHRSIRVLAAAMRPAGRRVCRPLRAACCCFCCAPRADKFPLPFSVVLASSTFGRQVVYRESGTRNHDEALSSPQVPPRSADSVARPAVAVADDRQGADLVQRRPARRQPGADRADGRRSQAADVPAAREDGLQGNRDRLSGRLADRLRLHAQADRRGPDSRRRHGPGADAVARGADRAHVRSARRRRPRDRPSVQLDVDHAAPPRVRPRPRRHQGHRRLRRQADPRPRREPARHRVVPRILAGELHRRRSSTSRWRSATR